MSQDFELPPLTQKPLKYVDSTPNEDYPLRILRAYREDCNCMWVEDTSGTPPKNPLFQLMNEHNRQRAEILDRAIERLSRHD